MASLGPMLSGEELPFVCMRELVLHAEDALRLLVLPLKGMAVYMVTRWRN